MKVQLPWMGKATGSSAGLIYQSYWGRTFARTFPAVFHYPNTPKQQICQAHFYDTQRILLLFYDFIKEFIGPQQRNNKNIYNIYAKAFIEALNPYNKPKFKDGPQNFGVDPYNRAILQFNDVQMFVNENRGLITFTQEPIKSEIRTTFNYYVLLIFNRTRQNIKFSLVFYVPTITGFNFTNDVGWQNGDDILVYTALQSKTWLGNFNRANT